MRLPRHPAVAYLFLVRRRVRSRALVISLQSSTLRSRVNWIFITNVFLFAVFACCWVIRTGNVWGALVPFLGIRLSFGACKTKVALSPKWRRYLSVRRWCEFEHGGRDWTVRLIRVRGYDPVAIR